MDQMLALRVFVRIAESGGFGKAADSLNIPRPTVTKLIQDLETHLRVKLFQRSTRKVTVNYFLSDPTNGNAAYNLVTADCTQGTTTIACSNRSRIGRARTRQSNGMRSAASIWRAPGAGVSAGRASPTKCRRTGCMSARSSQCCPKRVW